eukprot:scaffold20819_cov108-Isochrysis_galbana.AAC.6
MATTCCAERRQCASQRQRHAEWPLSSPGSSGVLACSPPHCACRPCGTGPPKGGREHALQNQSSLRQCGRASAEEKGVWAIRPADSCITLKRESSLSLHQFCKYRQWGARTCQLIGPALVELNHADEQLHGGVSRRLGCVHAAPGVTVLPECPAVEADEPEVDGGRMTHLSQQHAAILAEPNDFWRAAEARGLRVERNDSPFKGRPFRSRHLPHGGTISLANQFLAHI